MVKSAIRTEYNQKRLDLSPEEFETGSKKMVNIFSEMTLPVLDVYLSYYPLVKFREFDVSGCEKIVLEKNRMAKIAWPKSDLVLYTMEAHILEEHGMFAKNKYDILEPIGGHSIPPELVDLVFVPMLAVDLKGFRVGYGKGYYDRYLVRCRNNIIKIGFSFFEPIDAISDIGQFDVPLNYCITPSRLYEF